jgi:hypothetical protein
VVFVRVRHRHDVEMLDGARPQVRRYDVLTDTKDGIPPASTWARRFQVEARLLRRGLIDNRYSELAITSGHAVAIDSLRPIHKDPFDRLITRIR